MNTDVPLKTALEIERMRLRAEALERVLADLETVIRPGITTHDLDQVARLALARHGLQGVLEGYEGFPAAICASVNNVAAHGVPGSYVLREGDLITVDVSARRDAWYADAAWTYGVGRLGNEQRRLVRGAWRATLAGAAAARAGGRFGDIGAAIEAAAARNGCTVVREFTGHGIGTELHEAPVVSHVGEAGGGEPIVPGMVFNIEPVLTLGSGNVTLLDDGWSYVTSDGALAAQFEVTVAVRSEQTHVLTLARHAAPELPALPPFG
ncbi:MAG: type I methionyl aminopeptidase [Spirochaetota bacterium]